MALFEKKFCDICGEKIGMLGNRKLEDGNMCKDCASKLSPFFSERKHSTIDEIKEQLAYREANKQQVSAFHPTATFGDYYKLYIDQNMGAFVVSRNTNWRDSNPDVIPLSSVLNCNLDVKENKHELMRETPEGRKSYNPPRYEYHYDFDFIISVDNPYFDEIRMDLCSSSDRPTSMQDARYVRLQQVAMQMETALTGRSNISMSGGMGMNGMGMNGGMGMNPGNAVGAAVATAVNMMMGNQSGMQNQMGGMNQMGSMNNMGMQNQMGMNQMNNMGMQNQMGMNNMGMQNQMGMNQMNNMGMQNQMGMNQMNNMGMQNQMGMNQMNNMGMQNQMGMNQMNNMGMQNQMGGMNNMNMQNQMGMNQMPNQQMSAMNQAAGGTWTCACGTTNTGAFCEGCGNPRP